MAGLVIEVFLEEEFAIKMGENSGIVLKLIDIRNHSIRILIESNKENTILRKALIERIFKEYGFLKFYDENGESYWKKIDEDKKYTKIDKKYTTLQVLNSIEKIALNFRK